MALRILIITPFLLLHFAARSQQFVHWNFYSAKVNDTTFEIHLSALLTPGWHIYSQTQPDEGIANPTKILFTRTPIVAFEGTPKELGEMIKHQYKSIGVVQFEYENKLDFVQKVRVKHGLRTRVEGVIEYQICADRCMDNKVSFSVSVGS